MLDIESLRCESSAMERRLRGKIPDLSLEKLFSLDRQLREEITLLEQCRAEQNRASKVIGAKKREGQSLEEDLKGMKTLSSQVQELQMAVRATKALFFEEMHQLPNIPLEEVPVATDPEKNVVLKTVGSKPSFPFPIKNHLELGLSLGLFDLKRSAKITGSSWPLYTGAGARLERALLNYMLDTHAQNGFVEIMPPLLVNEKTMQGAGQLPKFRDQLFALHDPDFPFYLIPTAEVPLNGLHQEEIVSQLPLLYTAYTPCFRREAGALGRQERGLIRMHQFNKVELFAVCRPEESAEIFEKILQSAEKVLEGLGLHYRNMLLVTGDLSFSAEKTIDIEAFLPAQATDHKGGYYEVSSVSRCGAFQARRASIRFRGANGVEYAHTLNASGLATSRLMVSLLETHQNEEGSIDVPQALIPYLGQSKIEPKAL
ncbi:MAG: serine--tRNA ligase [Chlamydiota bacterium]